jgi:hypothetical protein
MRVVAIHDYQYVLIAARSAAPIKFEPTHPEGREAMKPVSVVLRLRRHSEHGETTLVRDLIACEGNCAHRNDEHDLGAQPPHR